MKAVEDYNIDKSETISIKKSICRYNTLKTWAALALTIIVITNNLWILSPHLLSREHPKTKCQSEIFQRLGESLNPQTKTGLWPLFITKDVKLMCPQVNIQVMRHRLKYFSDMIRSGLPTHHRRILSKYGHLLNDTTILLLMGGDDNGCDVTKYIDQWNFPRLTWSIPSTQIDHDNKEWCLAIGVPTYEIWRRYGQANVSDVLENNDLNYPWEEKYPRLGWRGSPTRYNNKYLHIPFEEIPRAKLGKVSLDNPEIIDAALTRIPEGLENVTDVLNPKTRLANRIPMEDFMKYKGERNYGFDFRFLFHCYRNKNPE